MIKLSADKDWCVRCAIAYNLNTPEYVLRNLATDEDIMVLKAIAANSCTMSDVLKEMVNNEDNYSICKLTYN